MSRRTDSACVAAITWITVALLAGACSSAQAADSVSCNERSVRETIQSVIDDSRRLMVRAPVSPRLARDLEWVETRLHSVPDADLLEVSPILSEELGRMRQLMADLVELVESGPRSGQPTDAMDWPNAIYPSLDWTFVITGDTNPDQEPPGEGDSASQGGVCSHLTALAPEGKVWAYNIALAFEGVRGAASWACQAAPFGELLCIVTDIAYVAAHGVVDNLFLCYDLMMEAEVTGTYRRLDHLHDDLIATQSAISDRIDAMTLDVVRNVDFNEKIILDVDSDLVGHDADMKRRTDQIRAKIESLSRYIAESRAENVRIQIEGSLADSDNKTVGMFQMPEALGGHLELVRAIVAKAIELLQAAGQDVGNAEATLARGERYLAVGDWARAYGEFARAYRTASR